ncbi:MAG: hypothetical protein ABSA30_13895, partial [Candidatus Aminicenantales bacterium]
MPRLAERLDRLFYDMAVRKANLRWLRELMTAVDPPRWDPRWNRAQALIAEKEDARIQTIEEFWLAYLEDLASIPDLKPGERALAQAMIWERLGRAWADDVDDREDDYEDDDEYEDDYEDGDEDDYEDQEGDDDEPDVSSAETKDGVSGRDCNYPARTKTIECLNKAISLAPGVSTAYHALAKNYVQWKQEDAAAEVQQRLLAHVPEDIDAIVALFHYHRKREDGLAARDYALQARRLKPASAEMLGMVVGGHYLAARCLAIEGRVDEARAELAAAGAADLRPHQLDYDLTVRRAMVEFKAGQLEAGRRLVDQALKEGGNPSGVYLALAIEAVRYDLPFQLADLPAEFRDRWLSSLKKRNSLAAGAMSARMWAFLQESE